MKKLDLTQYTIQELEKFQEEIEEELSTRFLILPSVVREGEKGWCARIDENTHRILEFEKCHNYKVSKYGIYKSKEFWLSDGYYRGVGINCINDGKDTCFRIKSCKIYLL